MILKNPKFLYLWASQILSQVTVNVMNFLLLTRLFTITGSSIATSLLWVSYALPSIFFGPIGAASVDLVSRRKMLMITNLLQALIIFVYIFIHQTSIFLLYFVVMAYSFLNQFYVPAESSSLPSVVPKAKLPQANSLFFITQQAALVIGFGFAGIVQKLIGFDGSLILASIFLFIAFVSVSFLPEMTPQKKIPESLDKLLLTFFESIYEGYKFIKTKKTVLLPLLLLLGIQTALAMIVVNLPLIAQEILKISVSLLGLLLVIPAGIGATLGSVIVSRLLKKNFRKKWVIEYGLIFVAVAIILLMILPVYLAPILLIAAGAGFIAVNIPTLTFLQEVTPLWLRGRVFGNLWFLVTIVTIFPVLFSGLITEFLGVRVLLVVIALGAIFVFYYSRSRGQVLIEENFENGR